MANRVNKKIPRPRKKESAEIQRFIMKSAPLDLSDDQIRNINTANVISDSIIGFILYATTLTTGLGVNRFVQLVFKHYDIDNNIPAHIIYVLATLSFGVFVYILWLSSRKKHLNNKDKNKDKVTGDKPDR